MSDTRPDITIPKEVWTNLYTASGITVGTSVSVTNKGSTPFYVTIQASAPSVTPVPKGIPAYVGSSGNTVVISTGASGAWAFSPQFSTIALVQE